MADEAPTPSFISIARPSPGVQITPAAVYISPDGRIIPLKDRPSTFEVTAIKSGGKTGMARLFIPMTFSLKIPNDRFPVTPLTLYVTPSEIQVTRRKALTEHVIRQGTIREEWGDELDVWTCSGTIAAFYTPAFGLTQVNRNQTAGYHNFLSLLSIYKINGRSYYSRSKAANPEQRRRDSVFRPSPAAAYFNRENFNARRASIEPLLKEHRSKFQTDLQGSRISAFLQGQSQASFRNFLGAYRRNVLNEPSKIIQHVGYVEINYDFRSVEGHFDSFEWKDSVDNPHQIKYSFTFTVTKQFDSVAEATGFGTPRA